LKRETHEEEKNNQKGGGRGRRRRETKGFALLPKLAQMKRFQVREERFFLLDSPVTYKLTFRTIFSDGRITLIKSTLSNLPTYFMSLFPLSIVLPIA
jgi:hypothetical protein